MLAFVFTPIPKWKKKQQQTIEDVIGVLYVRSLSAELSLYDPTAEQ